MLLPKRRGIWRLALLEGDATHVALVRGSTSIRLTFGTSGGEHAGNVR